MTGLKLAIFSMAAGSMPIAQAFVPDGITDTARTLEQSSPTFVLAAIAIIFAYALIKQSKRIEQLTDERTAADKAIMTEMLNAIQKNTEASTAVKTVMDECHRRNMVR